MASLSLKHIYKKYPGGVTAVSDFNLEVNTVKQRAGDFGLVVQSAKRGARAFVSGDAQVAAAAGVHGGNELEFGGIGGVGVNARDGDNTVF